jgi:hypothetical protein
MEKVFGSKSEWFQINSTFVGVYLIDCLLVVRESNTISTRCIKKLESNTISTRSIHKLESNTISTRCIQKLESNTIFTRSIQKLEIYSIFTRSIQKLSQLLVRHQPESMEFTNENKNTLPYY